MPTDTERINWLESLYPPMVSCGGSRDAKYWLVTWEDENENAIDGRGADTLREAIDNAMQAYGIEAAVEEADRLRDEWEGRVDD